MIFALIDKLKSKCALISFEIHITLNTYSITLIKQPIHDINSCCHFTPIIELEFQGMFSDLSLYSINANMKLTCKELLFSVKKQNKKLINFNLSETRILLIACRSSMKIFTTAITVLERCESQISSMNQFAHCIRMVPLRPLPLYDN